MDCLWSTREKRVVRMATRMFLLNKWKNGMSFIDIRKIAGEKLGHESKEFTLEHIKCKLQIKYPSGDDKLS